ncbi:MAG: alkaline phosphatase family protein [Acidimicrobiia bacterium]|nr:alkaline phosphatase family protein [Acidimicrobiia bacterium]
MDPIAPDYEGACVTGLLPALLGLERAAWLPPGVEGAESVVLLVLDGLGAHALDDHPRAVPLLRSFPGGTITTVAPSTTASALTSIATGLAPARHGIIGYRMLVGGAVLNVLRWQSSEGHPPDPFDVQRHQAFRGREVPVVTKAEFRKSGFTRAHLREGRFVGWHTESGLVEHCRRLVEAGERVVYAYYAGVDAVAHEYGLLDGFFERELAAVDDLADRLLSALPRSAALVVTSDHGQVHLDGDSWLRLDDVAEMVEVYAGDGRFRALYARKGAARELLEVARESYGHVAWVRSRAELLDDGWLGEGATGSVPGRIGDVVLAAREPVAFVDPTFPKEAKLRSGHGSLTPDEMLVPLLAHRGRA